jgi:hypothetical protein
MRFELTFELTESRCDAPAPPRDDTFTPLRNDAMVPLISAGSNHRGSQIPSSFGVRCDGWMCDKFVELWQNVRVQNGAPKFVQAATKRWWVRCMMGTSDQCIYYDRKE